MDDNKQLVRQDPHISNQCSRCKTKPEQTKIKKSINWIKRRESSKIWSGQIKQTELLQENIKRMNKRKTMFHIIIYCVKFVRKKRPKIVIQLWFDLTANNAKIIDKLYSLVVVVVCKKKKNVYMTVPYLSLSYPVVIRTMCLGKNPWNSKQKFLSDLMKLFACTFPYHI